MVWPALHGTWCGQRQHAAGTVSDTQLHSGVLTGAAEKTAAEVPFLELANVDWAHKLHMHISKKERTGDEATAKRQKRPRDHGALLAPWRCTATEHINSRVPQGNPASSGLQHSPSHTATSTILHTVPAQANESNACHVTLGTPLQPGSSSTQQ